MHHKNKIQISTALIDDIEAIQSVGRSAWWDTYAEFRSEEYILFALETWWSKDYLKKAIESDGNTILVAKEQRQIVGVLESQVLNQQSAIIWKLYVPREHRRKGIGKLLIDECIKRFPSGTEVCYTEYDSQNENAASFYGSQGFIFDKTEQGNFRGEAIVSIYVKRYLTGVEIGE